MVEITALTGRGGVMRSIWVKLTAAFVMTSLMAIAAVAIFAHQLLIEELTRVNVETAFKEFKLDVAAYIDTYGSWQQAREAEPFGEFERRRRAVETLIGERRLQTNCGNVDAAEALALERSVVEETPVSMKERVMPPFQFRLVAPQGDRLLGPRDNGSIQQSVHRRTWQDHPIIINGQTVAYAIQDKTPNLNAFDQSYQRVMRQALGGGLAIAVGISLLIGSVLARQFSRPIQRLTTAVQGMHSGQLRQQVVNKSRDEIGVLSRAFNQMSLELAEAYEKLEQSHRQIRDLSIRDDLTQLYNRRYFNEQGVQMMAQARRYNTALSVMIGDIDCFKRINDGFSHQMGDRVLQQVAQILMQQTRTSDIVARYGGEEFVIVFPETELAQATRLCDRLRRKIQNHGWREIHPDLNVTISMGVNADVRLGSLEKMIAVADTKLYQAKRGGRNQVCC
ncbi:MAG: diguanylate cyclase [Cyanobacteria bacterium P01_C01_bin.73]